MKTYENLFLVKKDWIGRRTEKQPFKVAFDPFVWGSIILRFFSPIMILMKNIDYLEMAAI